MYNQLQAQKFRIHDYQRHTELTFLADHHNNIFYRNAFVNLYISILFKNKRAVRPKKTNKSEI